MREDKKKLKDALTVIGDYCESRRKDCKDCLFYEESEEFRKCKLKIVPMDWQLEINLEVSEQ